MEWKGSLRLANQDITEQLKPSWVLTGSQQLTHSCLTALPWPVPQNFKFQKEFPSIVPACRYRHPTQFAEYICPLAIQYVAMLFCLFFSRLLMPYKAAFKKPKPRFTSKEWKSQRKTVRWIIEARHPDKQNTPMLDIVKADRDSGGQSDWLLMSTAQLIDKGSYFDAKGHIGAQKVIFGWNTGHQITNRNLVHNAGASLVGVHSACVERIRLHQQEGHSCVLDTATVGF